MVIREMKGKWSSDRIRQGVIRGTTLSDKLESATVIITNSEKIKIDKYDMIQLTDDSNKNEFWLVGDFTCSYATYEAPFKFNYTINLVELTKILEFIPLPNMTITNIGQNRDLRWYIANSINRYFANDYFKIRTFQQDITIFNDYIAPECTFNEPTLREYLDYLMSFKGCLAKLIFNTTYMQFELRYKDLNVDNGVMPTRYIKNIDIVQSGTDYADTLSHTLSDVVNKNTVIEYHELKSDGHLLDSNSAKIILHSKPYHISRVVVKNVKFYISSMVYARKYKDSEYPYWTYPDVDILPGRENNDSWLWFDNSAELHFGTGGNTSKKSYNNKLAVLPEGTGLDIDITKYLVEENIFNSLKTLSKGSYNYKDTKENSINYKNNSLKWARGSTSIENFNYYQSKQVVWWTESDETAIEHAIKSAIINKLSDWFRTDGGTSAFQANTQSSYTEDGTGLTVYGCYFTHEQLLVADGETWDKEWYENIHFGYDWKNIKFEIEYESYTNCNVRVDRPDGVLHAVTVIDNTANSTTDIKSFINQSMEKSKQLGNESLIFTARTPITSLPYYSVGQYFIDDEGNKYVVNELESETKSNCIMYKGVLSKNYSNRNINAVLNRDVRYYSLPDASSSVTREETLVVRIKLVLSSFSHYDSTYYSILVKKPNIAKYTTTTYDGNITGCIPCKVIKGGNLIAYNIAFMDNIIASTSVGDSVDGGYKMDQKRYTDSKGELTYITTKFGIGDSDYQLDAIIKGNASSDIFSDFETGSYGFDLKKDARERLSLTVEYVYCSTDSNIIMGRNFSSIGDVDTLNYKLETETGSAEIGSIKLRELVGSSDSVPIEGNGKLTIYDDAGNTYLTILNYNGEFIGFELD